VLHHSRLFDAIGAALDFDCTTFELISHRFTPALRGADAVVSPLDMDEFQPQRQRNKFEVSATSTTR